MICLLRLHANIVHSYSQICVATQNDLVEEATKDASTSSTITTEDFANIMGALGYDKPTFVRDSQFRYDSCNDFFQPIQSALAGEKHEP